MTTTNDDESKLDNATVRRFAKLLKNNTETASPVVTGTVIQNGNEISVAVDSETIVPITDTNTNVNVGDKVTLSFNDDKALIIGNITDANPTTSEVVNIDSKASTATKKAETAQKRAEGAEKVATNYIDIDKNKGITVGNITEEELGSNAYIDANGFSVREGTDTCLAHFGRNETTGEVEADIGKHDELHLTVNNKGLTVYNGEDRDMDFKQIKDNYTGEAGYIIRTKNMVFLSPEYYSSAGVDANQIYLSPYKTNDDGTITFFNGATIHMVDSKNASYINIYAKGKVVASIDSDGLSVKGKSVSVEGHTHTTSDLSDVDTLAKAEHTHTKSDISDFAHTHTSSDISGTIPISKGGTGSTTASGALTALGGAKASHTHKKADISDFSHTHTKSEISDFDHTHTKDEITDFTHTHTKSDITDFAHTHTKSDITDFSHTHAAGDITSGTLPLARGGTGQTTIAGLRTALGLDDAVQVVTVTSKYTAAANAGVQFNVTATTKTGYTFVGCVGKNTASAFCYFATCKKTSATNLQVYVKNTSSSSITATAQFYLLYVKSIFA